VTLSTAPQPLEGASALPDLLLASRSPRRRRLLEEAGLRHEARAIDLDDAVVRLQGDPAGPVATMALAWFKARRALDRLGDRSGGGRRRAILAADTLCELDGRLLGQPRDRDEARAMLHGLRDRAHRTVTGLCLLDPLGGRRLLWAEVAVVEVGQVAESDLDDYLASGLWAGKAGAYSLDERIAAGWPIRCRGDREVVLGLPTRSLRRRLAEWSTMGSDRGCA
jgi:septum formation protein